MPAIAERKPIGRELKPGEKRFKCNLFVSKAYQDEAGELWLEGIASGTELDLQHERMAPECVASMAAQINGGQIKFLRSHYDDWDKIIGFIKEGRVEPGNELFVRVWLDKEMEEARTLFRRVNGLPEKGIAPSKLGMSIGGIIKDATSELVNGEYVNTIKDLELDHVVPTSSPAYPEARITGVSQKAEFARPWLHDICKSVDWRRLQAELQAELPVEDLAVERTEVEMVDLVLEDDEAINLVKDFYGAKGDSEMGKTLKGLIDGAALDEEPEDAGEATKADDGQGAADQGAAGNDGNAEPWKTGAWVAVKDMTGEESVWCMPPAAGKSEEAAEGEEGVSKTKEIRLSVSKGDAETLKLLAEERKARKALQAEIKELREEIRSVKSTGTRKGFRNAEADQRTEQAKTADAGAESTTAKSWIAALKESPEYQKATQTQKNILLNKAAQKEFERNQARILAEANQES